MGQHPKVAFAETCAGPGGPCSREKLTEQWINEQAVKDLASPPLNFDHLSPNGALLELDAGRRPAVEQSFRMMYHGNVASGAVFSDTQLQSSDYSLQLAMSLQNFISVRCANTGQQPDARPAICAELTAWSKAQRKATGDLLTFGSPGADGGPIRSGE